MKTQETINKGLAINLFVGNESVLRAYEISIVGSHVMKIVSSQLDAEQISIMECGLVGAVISKNHGIIVEAVKPNFDSLVSNRIRVGMETVVDINARIAKLKRIDVDSTLCDNSMKLLKAAYDKIDLMPYEVPLIIKIACTIAMMDGKDKVETYHLAEAIQYRSVKLNEKGEMLITLD